MPLTASGGRPERTGDLVDRQHTLTTIAEEPTGEVGRRNEDAVGRRQMEPQQSSRNFAATVAAAVALTLGAVAIGYTLGSSDTTSAQDTAPQVEQTFYREPDVQYFAEVVDGRVTQVVRVDAGTLNAQRDRYPGLWVETTPDGTLRGMFAGPGYHYDSTLDRFYPPQPFPSWTLDEQLEWTPPTPRPEQGDWRWDEPSTSWVPR